MCRPARFPTTSRPTPSAGKVTCRRFCVDGLEVEGTVVDGVGGRRPRRGKGRTATRGYRGSRWETGEGARGGGATLKDYEHYFAWTRSTGLFYPFVFAPSSRLALSMVDLLGRNPSFTFLSNVYVLVRHLFSVRACVYDKNMCMVFFSLFCFAGILVSPGLEGESGRFGHFGLGLSHYTHFTSPIRRYADIVVHRLLLASLGVSSTAASVCRRGAF